LFEYKRPFNFEFASILHIIKNFHEQSNNVMRDFDFTYSYHDKISLFVQDKPSVNGLYVRQELESLNLSVCENVLHSVCSWLYPRHIPVLLQGRFPLNQTIDYFWCRDRLPVFLHCGLVFQTASEVIR